MSAYKFTSESVSEGHPDKMCDQISDAILDAILEQDSNAKVACETLVKTGMVVVAGEVSTDAWVDIEQIVRNVVIDIGYDRGEIGFDGNSCAVINCLGKQSEDIAVGVNPNKGKAMGAGDQGLIFGYASDETEVLMPSPIVYCHRLMERQAMVRKNAILPWLRPDAKTQLTFRYENDIPIAIDTIVFSTQHEPHIPYQQVKEAVIEEIIKPVIGDKLQDDVTYHINPTGNFVIGGPVGDTGVTGRKIIVDTYGGMARHGGGAFSGKDPTKVDRSAAYATRYVAKNIVTAGVASKCEVQISYAIGVSEPTSIYVNCFGTSNFDQHQLENMVREHFDLTPQGIIDMLKLQRPIFQPTACYGHFGRNLPNFLWEQTDKAASIKASLRSLN